MKDAVSNTMVPNPFRLMSECGTASNARDDPTLGVRERGRKRKRSHVSTTRLVARQPIVWKSEAMPRINGKHSKIKKNVTRSASGGFSIPDNYSIFSLTDQAPNPEPNKPRPSDQDPNPDPNHDDVDQTDDDD